MFIIGFPLLVIPFAIYNMIVFLTPGVSWAHEVARIQLKSGEVWTITPGDLLVTLAILILFLEIVKATREAGRGIMDHLLSLILLGGMAAEFWMVKQAATPTFYLLLVVAFVEFTGGLAISLRVRRPRVRYREVVEDDRREPPLEAPPA